MNDEKFNNLHMLGSYEEKFERIKIIDKCFKRCGLDDIIEKYLNRNLSKEH